MNQKAIFAAGCFWGVEDTFMQIDGVISTRVGYTGGSTENPTYDSVCSGNTGHAEAVEVIFDTDKVTYKDLLNVFWSSHDPTTLNQQGLDIGEQYRSAIFYTSKEQKEEAEESKKDLIEDGLVHGPIVTQIVEEAPFYEAEEYHQKYLEKKGGVCGI